MSETAIAKFLAGQIWHDGREDDKRPCFFEQSDGEILVTLGGLKASDTFIFDPMNKIAHAFMVVEWIRKRYYKLRRENRDEEADHLRDTFEGYIANNVTDICIDLEPRHFAFAAARALATDEQLVEFGL